MAIKKIKVGQFKDGLDMSAIREVKYLRELKHENVIEVGRASTLAYVSLIMNSGKLSFLTCSQQSKTSILCSSFWTRTSSWSSGTGP